MKHPKNLAPTIEDYRFELPTEFIHNIIDKLKAISLPVLADFLPAGEDRINYHVVFGDFDSESHFDWSRECPPEWEPLKKVLEDILQSLDDKLTQITSEKPA